MLGAVGSVEHDIREPDILSAAKAIASEGLQKGLWAAIRAYPAPALQIVFGLMR